MTSEVYKSASCAGRSDFGSSGLVRRALIVLVSLVAVTFEFVLLLGVRRGGAHPPLSIEAYSLPLYHLLPWVTGWSVGRE